MRLTDAHIQSIRLLARQEAGEQVSVRVFLAQGWMIPRAVATLT